MPAKPRNDRPDPERMSFEQLLEELESIIGQIEEGKVGLEESLARYQRGTHLIRRCREILDKAEQEVERLTAPSPEEASAEPK
jgi:exodeoxyribonuclease VII small subunit